ncbi:MAG TPA: flagellar hook-length control protein FliK [Methylophilaceae bacterium]|jgi:hypothetical protein
MPERPAISPVSGITPVLPLKALGDAADEAGFRFAQLNLARLNSGQLYHGRIVAKLDDMSFLVALNGGMLRMVLDKGMQTGEMIALRYLGGSPQPAFLLVPPSPSHSQTSLSPAARMIGQLLTDSVPPRFEASQPVTDSPSNNAARIAVDLGQAVSMSGLFYESHLAEYLAGRRPLSALLQEPQNQSPQAQATLVSQQLQVLEQQRLHWYGEIWPGQTMDWEIHREEDARAGRDGKQADEAIASSVTLQLPRLGKVRAAIHHAGGRLRIELWAEQETTAGLLARGNSVLMKRLQAAGQQPDQVTVRRHDGAA